MALLGHTDCGIAAALLYTWITPGGDPSNPQDWYGLRVGGLGGSPVVDQMVDHPRGDVAAFAEGVRRAGRWRARWLCAGSGGGGSACWGR